MPRAASFAALVTALAVAASPAAVRAAPIEPVALDGVPDTELVRAINESGGGGDAFLELVTTTAGGAVLGEERATTGHVLVGVGLLTAIRATRLTYLRLRSAIALPLSIPIDDDDPGQLVEVPRGRHHGQAALGLSVPGSRDGLDLGSELELHHGAERGTGLRPLDLGPGDFLRGAAALEVAPRFHLDEDGPTVLRVPLRYTFSGAALLEERFAERSAGYVRHLGSLGVTFSGFSRSWLPEYRIDILHVELGQTSLDLPPLADDGSASQSEIGYFGGRILRFDAVFVPDNEFFVAAHLDLGMSLIGDDRRDAVTFTGGVGIDMRDGNRNRFGLAVTREATHAADATRLLGETRFAVVGALGPAEFSGFGAKLDAAFAWVDDLTSAAGLDDTHFRLAIDTELFAEVITERDFGALEIGAYYLLERNFAFAAQERWDPWQSPLRLSHEVAGFVRWRAAVD